MPLFKQFQSRSSDRHSFVPQSQSRQQKQALESVPVSSNLEQNEAALRDIYANYPDAKFRSFCFGQHKALLLFINGLSDLELIHSHVLMPLMMLPSTDEHDLHSLLEKKLTVAAFTYLDSIPKVIESISLGNPCLFVNGLDQAVALELPKWDRRSIEEPKTETVVRGPREGFTESIAVNVAMLRRKIKSPDLKLLPLQVGEKTKTQLFVAYIEGVAQEALIDEVMNRLNRIEIDGVLESGYIEELIEDNPFSPFPQLLETERPDVAAGSLLEGRIAILTDGTPFVLIAPASLFSLLTPAEDYYNRWMMVNAIRLLRFLFLFISFTLPSIYIAITTFHQQMLPSNLLVSFAMAREIVPFPAIAEALLMEVTFEALREAGVRLPKQVGAAVSIVGAIVIGEAAVMAGLISAPMVLVVAITGISSFVVTHYSLSFSFRVLRFPLMLLAGSMGLVGVLMGILALAVHLCTLRSFGLPYLAGAAPMMKTYSKDLWIRAPWWAMNKLPRLSGEADLNRQGQNQKPGPDPQQEA